MNSQFFSHLTQRLSSLVDSILLIILVLLLVTVLLLTLPFEGLEQVGSQPSVD